MNERTHVNVLRFIFKKFGITISILLTFFGIFIFSVSDDILEVTFRKWFTIPYRIDEGLVRIISILMILVLLPIFKIRLTPRSKKTDFVYGILQCYPLVAIGFSAFAVGTFYNLDIGNRVMYKTVFELAFYMITVGIYEELLFRGIIQRILLRKFKKENWIYAIAIQAFLFGGSHLGNHFKGVEKCTQCVFACFAGFFFGLAYYKSKSIVSVMIVHAFYDFSLNFTSCFSLVGSNFEEIGGIDWTAFVLATALCVLLFVVNYYWPERKKRTYTLREVELELGLINTKYE